MQRWALFLRKKQRKLEKIETDTEDPALKSMREKLCFQMFFKVAQFT